MLLQNNGSRLTTSPEPGSRPNSRDRAKTPLLSPVERRSKTSTPDPSHDYTSAGFEIQRPRSALHSGDFREKKAATTFDNGPSASDITLATSPVAPWHHSFPAGAIPSSRGGSLFPTREVTGHDSRSTVRSRAVSHSSFSTPFVYMPPTSPLVQQSNNTDLDFGSRPTSRQSSRSPERSNWRHSYSSHSFQTYHSTQIPRSATRTSGPQLKREGTAPCQAHQPRRSLSSFNQFQPQSIPQGPFLQQRRPSISSEASPLHHAPMVGSYEESILRGRMSTTPSRPLDFVARIGVLGKGQCKANLRCPPHVTVPFPAVFYSYSGGNNRIADNSPSPYVGLIDLENSLTPPEESSETRRKRRHTIPNPGHNINNTASGITDDPSHTSENIRRREKSKRRSTSPKAPPGGSYRIPQQGQLQIIIKNPSETAVKLFLVPYDLSDMEPGQKTFIRQRSYSAGPIIDMPMSHRPNLGTDRPEAALSNSDDPNDRPILRYLIHLHICCPSKGRYYLYKSIRVVFANRVPDGKEKLRNETQLPEPPYSTYKANRDPMVSQPASSAATQPTAEKAFRRRSAGFSLSQQAHDGTQGYSQRPPPPPPAVQFTGGNANGVSTPVSSLEPIPFSLARTPNQPPDSREHMDIDSNNPFAPRTDSSPKTDTGSPLQRNEAFEKLSRGDLGYGGNAFCGVGVPSEGLLARKLRGLDVDEDMDS